jgi:outer membrane protein
MSNERRSEMMKTRALVTGLATTTALLFFLGICGAQDIKVGFVDLMKFAQQSKKAQEQQQRLMKMAEKERTTLENKEKELVALQDQLQKQGPMLKEETRNQKVNEFNIKKMELEMAKKDAQNKLQNEQREAQELIQKDVSKVIGHIRTQKKLTLVFNSAALLSADDALDITDDVVRLYDAEAGKAPAAKSAPAKPAAPKPAVHGPAKPRAK